MQSISILLTTIYNCYPKEDTDIKTREEVITLPESTHSFLFTEPVNSLPFAFGVGIAVISYTCLALALQNNLKCGVIPSNVDISVRVDCSTNGRGNSIRSISSAALL